MTHDLNKIIGRFNIRGDFVRAEPYGAGHINDSYAVTSNNLGQRRRYILQRINKDIFKDPMRLMENVLCITNHIRKKLQAHKEIDIDRKVLNVIMMKDGGCCCFDDNGNYWRMYDFIENAQTYNVLTSLNQAYKAARAFGRFQRLIADMGDSTLTETIPDFHNTPKRLNDFLAVLDKDPFNRASLAKDEIKFVVDRAPICDRLLGLARTGAIPTRITHNDTKINNVLFDRDTEDAICVIDLDTVMPGLSLYDFGDMVRTATCQAAEDERDLSKIQVDVSFYKQIARGYAHEAVDFLTDSEKENLVFAGKLITFEQMIRFLGDYLNGDSYYKIHRAGHNMDRARTQMKLVLSIEEKEEQLTKLTEKIWQERV